MNSKPWNFYWLILLVCASCSAITSNEPTKINGASVVAPPQKFSTQDLQPLKVLGANTISTMPYAYVDEKTGKLQYDMVGKQWYGETKQGTIECIKMAHELNLKVMLKPHVWIGWGVFTGTYKPSGGYENLKQGYKQYVLDFAALAEKENVAYFCFGTEWKQFAKEEKLFFNKLIDEIRTIYTGKITYAANWDNAFYIPFWDKLDFIGIDAYFPLIDNATPSITDLNAAWAPWKEKIKSLSSSYKKPILFTEYGFRNIDACANKPWESHNELSTNNTCQCNGYQSLFDTFWDEPWFAGGFFWKYHTQLRNSDNNMFTPQQKPAWEIIKKRYHLKN